jgi:hypothetical protein
LGCEILSKNKLLLNKSFGVKLNNSLNITMKGMLQNSIIVILDNTPNQMRGFRFVTLLTKESSRIISFEG